MRMAFARLQAWRIGVSSSFAGGEEKSSSLPRPSAARRLNKMPYSILTDDDLA
jgi:hypothetical protein